MLYRSKKPEVPGQLVRKELVGFLGAVPDVVDNQRYAAGCPFVGNHHDVRAPTANQAGNDIARLVVSAVFGQREFAVAALEVGHQVGHPPVINTLVRPSGTPVLRVFKKGRLHVFVYEPLQVVPGGAKGADHEVRTHAGVVGNVTAGILQAHVAAGVLCRDPDAVTGRPGDAPIARRTTIRRWIPLGPDLRCCAWIRVAHAESTGPTPSTRAHRRGVPAGRSGMRKGFARRRWPHLRRPIVPTPGASEDRGQKKDDEGPKDEAPDKQSY